jgi:hypothetical protein
MRAKDFITESMTFGPTEEQSYVDNHGKQRKIWSGDRWWRKEEKQCWVCDGTGKDKYHGDTCDFCSGKGTYNDTVSDAPELNVSNSNGFAIQEMLGLNPEYSGIIFNKDLPTYIRKLILLKNKGSQEYTKDSTTTQGPMKKVGTDQNITSISRGPTMIDYGRSQTQVDRYIDELLKIMKFAQENNASLSWG